MHIKKSCGYREQLTFTCLPQGRGRIGMAFHKYHLPSCVPLVLLQKDTEDVKQGNLKHFWPRKSYLPAESKT